MEALSAEGYETARWLVQRGVALTCLIAFVNVVTQWRPLLGDGGLTPAREVLRARPTWWSPSLFHLRYSDRGVVTVGVVGALVSAAVLLGAPQAGPAWVPLLAFLVLWALYLSVVTIGRTWYAFGWESLLLEATFLAAFLGDAATAPPWLTLLLVRWLLFRVEVGAGLIKLRGDPCWRDLTCLHHHHETQPLPGPLSWRFHRLPDRAHRVEVLANHVAQLVLPFGLFLPQPVAGACAVAIGVTQLWLVVSGNFAWLNLITLVLATAALPDAWLTWLPVAGRADASTSTWLTFTTVAVAGLVVLLSARGPVPNLLSRHQRMNTSHDPLRLVNSYGAFGSVTRTRHELEIEATTAEDPTAADARWQRYGFRGKPGPVDRRPPQVAPRHLRLDWLLWFAAMEPSPAGQRWFVRLLERLAVADRATLRLLRHDPLDGARPTALRVVRERTRFTTREERRRTGDVWVREDPTVVVPPVALEDGRLRPLR